MEVNVESAVSGVVAVQHTSQDSLLGLTWTGLTLLRLNLFYADVVKSGSPPETHHVT